MKINNVELEEIDLMDAEIAENVETAMKQVTDRSKEVEKLTSLGEMIRVQCDIVFECFDTVFGEGTSKDVFEDRVNLRECVGAFEELMAAIDEKKGNVEKEFSKYTPNRADRRRKK